MSQATPQRESAPSAPDERDVGTAARADAREVEHDDRACAGGRGRLDEPEGCVATRQAPARRERARPWRAHDWPPATEVEAEDHALGADGAHHAPEVVKGRKRLECDDDARSAVPNDAPRLFSSGDARVHHHRAVRRQRAHERTLWRAAGDGVQVGEVQLAQRQRLTIGGGHRQRVAGARRERRADRLVRVAPPAPRVDGEPPAKVQHPDYTHGAGPADGERGGRWSAR